MIRQTYVLDAILFQIEDRINYLIENDYTNTNGNEEEWVKLVESRRQGYIASLSIVRDVIGTWKENVGNDQNI